MKLTKGTDEDASSVYFGSKDWGQKFTWHTASYGLRIQVEIVKSAGDNSAFCDIHRRDSHE
jgi:hypothetical protein